MTVTPCIHPTCDDGNGNAALTTQTICDRCRRHYRREIDWLVMDYITIKSSLPQPASNGSGTRRTTRTSFGHPAEWASDRTAEIADMLNDGENQLRAAVNATDPALYVAPEQVRVANAYRYITDRWDEFCTFDAADEFADAIHETHRTLRSALGLTKPAQRLPVPCPSCEVAALVRTVGLITCAECSRTIREDQYGLFTRIAVDFLIDQYDTQKAERLA